MSKYFEFLLGYRYVRSKSSNKFVSLISLISMSGIAIAVAVLIIVMSVVNGFERELRDRLLAMTEHASIEATDGHMRNADEIISIANNNSRVNSVAPYIDGEALLVFKENISGTTLRGIDPTIEYKVSGIADVMQIGSLESLMPGSYQIILGLELANAMNVKIGDKVTLTLAEGRVTPAGLIPRTKRFTVSGIFRVGMYEFDHRLAFINIADAKKLFLMDDSISGIRLSVDNIYQAPEIVREIALENGKSVLVNDWTRSHINFFRSIQVTKSILFIILLMVISVAVFNIVSTLFMVVKDKQADIAILKSIGASPLSVLKIFITQGSIIGIIGTFMGISFGIAVAVNLELIIVFFESLFGIKFLAADVYFISDLPSEVVFFDVFMIGLLTLLLTLISTIYPAWVSARTAPAEALKYD
ncbi:MAG: lipoprotein-releasing system transmembrane subunit LolC [Gammaproteobacteria bacterium]|nr:lipoprotein-releasing system transmembrane subunit LolC [Gammaproteobacteria bacterium]